MICTESMHRTTVEDIGTHIITGLVGLVSAILGGLGVWYRVKKDSDARQLEASVAADAAKYEASASQNISFLEQTMSRVQRLETHNTEQDKTIERLVRENATLSARVDLLTEQNKILLDELERIKKQRDQAISRASEAEQKAVDLNNYIQTELSEAVERVDTLESESDAVHDQ